MQLTMSQEMYLKTLYSLAEKGTVVQAKDVAARLRVSRPSVTEALKQLAAKKLVNYSRYGAVSLTKKGERYARQVADRFEIVCQFLMRVLGVPEHQAIEAACSMEHTLPPVVRDKLAEFLAGIGQQI